MDAIKDSTFLNVVETLQNLENAQTKPNVRGARSAATAMSEDQAKANLKDDIEKMVLSALSQREKVQPVPGLDASQLTALRALYAIINNGKSTEKDLELAVHAAVKSLNPEFQPKVEEQKEEAEGENMVTGTSIELVTKRL
jgi:hypothetical protein